MSEIVVRDSSIVGLHPSQIVVRDNSRDTAIVGSPLSQVVNLVTPSTTMTKASSSDIETTSIIPRDTIRLKTRLCVYQHNAEKRNSKKRVDGTFITAKRQWHEEKTQDKN